MISRYTRNTDRLMEFIKNTLQIYGAAILIYIPINIYNCYFTREYLLPNIIKDLVFDGTLYHLWYLPAAVLGGAIAWHLVKKADYTRAMAIAFGLYLIGLFGDSYYGVAEMIPGILPDDAAFTEKQINRFYRLMDLLKRNNVTVPKIHIQSSNGLLNYPNLKCDYARIGIALYGVLTTPDYNTDLKPDLRPVLSLKTRVVHIQDVSKGESVGYSRAFTAERDSRIAILLIGYGDGFPRNLSCGKGYALIRDQLVPIVGRICMDQLAVDVTDIDSIAVGDTATLIETNNEEKLSAPMIADISDSISNELLCRIGARLPVVERCAL